MPLRWPRATRPARHTAPCPPPPFPSHGHGNRDSPRRQCIRRKLRHIQTVYGPSGKAVWAGMPPHEDYCPCIPPMVKANRRPPVHHYLVRDRTRRPLVPKPDDSPVQIRGCGQVRYDVPWGTHAQAFARSRRYWHCRPQRFPLRWNGAPHRGGTRGASSLRSN